MADEGIKAKGKEVLGGAKEQVGKVTGDEEMEAEGKADKVEGKAEGIIDKAKDKIDEIKKKVT